MTVIERKCLERMKLGIWDDGTIAGVYMPEAEIGKRPDLTVVEYVRADLHEGAVALLYAIGQCANTHDALDERVSVRVPLRLLRAARAATIG